MSKGAGNGSGAFTYHILIFWRIHENVRIIHIDSSGSGEPAEFLPNQPRPSQDWSPVRKTRRLSDQQSTANPYAPDEERASQGPQIPGLDGPVYPEAVGPAGDGQPVGRAQGGPMQLDRPGYNPGLFRPEAQAARKPPPFVNPESTEHGGQRGGVRSLFGQVMGPPDG